MTLTYGIQETACRPRRYYAGLFCNGRRRHTSFNNFKRTVREAENYVFMLAEQFGLDYSFEVIPDVLNKVSV